ncbi:MAG: DUF4476 domain-containing protein [Chitinophagaceae bacterium]|nr:DUF4476 domain-containing protein [Chitinophagaceae bacterium]
MKTIKFLFLSSLLLLTGTLYAQFLPTSNLTIFSEDGYKFYLILNGERQNEVAQTNIRLEELPQPYYNCKIIFEDPTQKEITKNNLMLVDANNVHQDVTYKIKKDKSGKQVLRFYSFMPAEQNMIRPSNVPVYRFGQPNVIVSGPGFSQTTVVETRSGRNTGGANVNVNAGGLNMNVNINDPLVNTQMTTTTTTTTYHDGYEDNGNRNPGAGRNRTGCQGYAMSPGDFENARKTIADEGFDETRLTMAKQIISSNCMTSSQIVNMCKTFSFEESKLDFAKFAYEHCSDPGNYFNVNNVFSFSSSKTELSNYIQGR